MTCEKAEILAKARVRFIIDVDLSILNMPGALLEGIEQNSDYPVRTRDDRRKLLFQQKLLMAVLANPDTFQAVTVNQAGYEASTKFEERWIYSNPEEDRMKSLIKDTAISCFAAEEWKDVKVAANEEDFVGEISRKLTDAWKATPGDISIHMVVQHLK